MARSRSHLGFCCIAWISCLARLAHAQPTRETPVATLAIVGVIDAETALEALSAVSSLPRRLDVTIDSPGGETPAADLIVRAFTSLRQGGSVVNCLVTGKAMSAAFWILQACSVRAAAPGAHLMIHEPVAIFRGETGELLVGSLAFLRSLVKGLEHDSDAIANTCAPRLHIAIPDWHTRLAAGDWKMTAPEALKAHALDSITS